MRKASKWASKPSGDQAGKKASRELSTHGGKKVYKKEASEHVRRQRSKRGSN